MQKIEKRKISDLEPHQLNKEIYNDTCNENLLAEANSESVDDGKELASKNKAKGATNIDKLFWLFFLYILLHILDDMVEGSCL